MNFWTTEYLKILPHNGTQLKLHWLMSLKSLLLHIWFNLVHQGSLPKIWALTVFGLYTFYWFPYKVKVAVSTCSPIISQVQVHQERLLTSLLSLSKSLLLTYLGHLSMCWVSSYSPVCEMLWLALTHMPTSKVISGNHPLISKDMAYEQGNRDFLQREAGILCQEKVYQDRKKQ